MLSQLVVVARALLTRYARRCCPAASETKLIYPSTQASLIDAEPGALPRGYEHCCRCVSDAALTKADISICVSRLMLLSTDKYPP
jgi:hypothetical protein